MISRKDLVELNLSDIFDMYQHIIDNKINGNFEQTKSLVKKLSPNQHSTFLLWMQENDIKFEKIYLKWEY